MAIFFTRIDVPTLLRGSRVLKEWLEGVILAEGGELGEITIALCSDSYITDVNVQFLAHDYATDIITFPYNEGKKVSGDLLISTETVKSNAVAYGASFSRELHRVMVHGVLHLLGYDDATDQEKGVMRAKEDEYLEVLASKQK